MKPIWLKLLPNYFQKQLGSRHIIQKAVSNSLWLFADKLIRMTVGLFISIWITRYLGPEQFGQLSYALAFVAIFIPLATMGLDNIAIKEMVEKPENVSRILELSIYIRFTGAVGALLLCMLAIFLLRSDNEIIYLVFIIAVGMIFRVFDVFDFWFQAKVQSKYSVIAKNSAFLLASIFTAILVLYQANVEMFAYASLLEVIIGGVFLFIIFKVKTDNSVSLFSRFDFIEVKKILTDSIPILLSGFSIMLYMRMDQIMIGHLLEDKAVGLYSAALRLSEVWYVIPAVVISSIYPRLIDLYNENEEKYTIYLMKIMGGMFWFGLSVALIFTMCSDWLTILLYGAEYAESANVLAIHIYTIMFVGMSVIFSHRFILKKMQYVVLYGSLVGVIVNYILNSLLIPVLGLQGAAIATLASYFFPAIFQSVFFDKSIIYIFYMSIFEIFKFKSA